MKLIACGYCSADAVLICSGVARIEEGGVSKCFRCNECGRLTWREFPALPAHQLRPLRAYEQQMRPPKLGPTPHPDFTKETRSLLAREPKHEPASPEN